METIKAPPEMGSRNAPIDISPEEFRRLGHALVDRLASFMEGLPGMPVTPGETPSQVRSALDAVRPLPKQGTDPGALLSNATGLLLDHSLFNAHPRFFGFITAGPTPIGLLGDMLASAVNPNVGGYVLSPIATEIEAQTVRWIAEMLNYPTNCGGLLVSGGNMANFVGFLAARRARATWDVRAEGMNAGHGKMRVYTSAETHTWVQKAADLFGLGTEAVRWIPTDSRQRMNTQALRRQIQQDRDSGDLPIMVIGTAGSVSTGAIDPLPEIAAICREHDLWFHVDGAYGGFAAALPDVHADLRGLSEADSVAIDPHKWLYAPLEAGCALVRRREDLHATFEFHPAYYHMIDMAEDPAINYHEYGMQNSRGFRALKVWLALQHVGLEGYRRMIADDIALSKEMFRAAGEHPELEACTQALSITTFRYVPPGVQPGTEDAEVYLNRLNTELLDRLQAGGETFMSNAIVDGKFLLRACIVNFRTSIADVLAVPEIVVRVGRQVHQEMER
ncbi:MAG TPA: aminotransferase class V-fold PLP-dependent enzyme [Chloroflexia bacterium]|nr:aminotransferase class V-fold PLP-dependent enzyme [Chloroflexia bacterium]